MEGSLVAYKVFTNGSTLQASEVNENLMQQSVATFSNAAARTAAITSPVEGQMTYLEDVDLISIYESGAWRTSLNPRGGILQVISTAKTDTQVSSVVAAGEVAITGLNATITPKSSTNKILVLVQASIHQDNFFRTAWAVKRNSTYIGIGDAASNRSRIQAGISTNNDGFSAVTSHGTFLDSPGTTSAITYSVFIRNLHNATNNVLVNRTITDSDTSTYSRSSSTITLMEVSA
jgi:hypothetical protein